MRTQALAALLAACPVAAHGVETAAFLDVGVGARALGLGGAYTALGEEPHALYWNPAGTSRLVKRELAASHVELFESSRLDFIAYSHPTRRGTFSGGLTYLSQGSIEGRDSLGRPTSSYGASDAAVSLGYARATEWVDAGVALKYIRSHIASVEADGVALDLGVRRAIGGARFGAALRNLGPGMKFDDQRNDLPLRLALGAAYRFESGHAAAAELINGPWGTGTDVSLGGELQLVKNVFFRGGYTTRTAAAGGPGFDAARGLTLGMGWSDERWRLDYAVLPSGELGRAHRISLGARF